MPTDTPRYRATELIAFAEALFPAAGCEAEKATAMARHLVDADLMGHTTHGLRPGARLSRGDRGRR